MMLALNVSNKITQTQQHPFSTKGLKLSFFSGVCKAYNNYDPRLVIF